MKLRSQSSLRSLLAGVGIGVLGVVLMSQSPVDIRDLVRVEYGPHPKDMVQIREGTPYAVPPGKLFVLTALGHANYQDTCPYGGQLRVNGVSEVSTGQVASAESMVQEMPVGFTAAAGSILEVLSCNQLGRAWGQCR